MRNDVIDCSGLTISFAKAAYSALEDALDSNDAPYVLLATPETQVDHHQRPFLQPIPSRLAQTLLLKLQTRHQTQA